MTALAKADTDLFVLQVTMDNRIRFEVPRAEVGQGITTALAMIVAEELDARLADVDVPLSDARQDRRPAGSRCRAIDRRLHLGAQPVGSRAPARRRGPGPPGHRGRAG